MRISDWSSDVCSSDLTRADVVVTRGQEAFEAGVETLVAANTIVIDGVQELVQTNVGAGKELATLVQASVNKAKVDGLKAVAANPKIGRASCRERVCQYV